MSRTASKALLVVDVGNTSTSAGLFWRGRIIRQRATAVRTAGEIRTFLDTLCAGKAVCGAALATVVPDRQARWLRALRRAAGGGPVLNVDHRIPLGMPVTFPRPETIGPDRLANAAGMFARYGAPAVAIDIGTALTLDIVLRDQGYVGGVIAPGPALMMDYMVEKTARLPRVTFARARRFIGKSTEEAMRIGAWSGYVGIVRELLAGVRREIRAEYPGAGRLTVCATGGAADNLVPEIDAKIRVDRDLTLYGLARIYQLNRPSEP